MAGVLVNLVPLVRDELSDIRYGLHKSMVLSIISDMKVGDQTSIDDIKGKIIKKFNISDFPREVLSRIINDFDDDNLLRKDNRCYFVNRSIEIPSINAFIDNCYVEFRKILNENIKDFDLYIYREFENAFRECLLNIINNLINDQSSCTFQLFSRFIIFFC